MGFRPSQYYVYDESVTNEEKIEQVIDWLNQPSEERPMFIALYFNEANYYGHRLGPEGSPMDTVIQGLDQNIGQLITGLEELELLNKINIIIVADHGMVDLDEDKVAFLDDYIAIQDLERFHLGPVAMLDPVEGKLDSVYTPLLAANADFEVYKKEETPAHLHYRNHRRIPQLICIPDESGYVTTHYYHDNFGFGGYVATHGYDPSINSMQAVFLAAGPHFKKGITVPKFQNIHIYNLLVKILGVNGVDNDGNLDSVRAMLLNN